MRFGSGSYGVEQCGQAVFGFDVGEIGAMSAQLTKQWLVVGGNTLADDGDSEPRNRRRLGRDGRMQTVRVFVRGFAKCVELMRAPEMGGELFHELCGLPDPVEGFELWREADFVEILEPFLEFCGRKWT